MHYSNYTSFVCGNIVLCFLRIKSFFDELRFQLRYFCCNFSQNKRIVMTLPCKMLVIAWLLSLMVLPAYGQESAAGQEKTPPPTAQELMKWHEVFTYEIEYGFFKLGEVRVEVISDTVYGNHHRWHLRSVITSNSGIPFVGEEENHYNTLFTIADSTFRSQLFWTDNMDEKEYNTSRYTFDYKADKVYAYEKGAPRDTLRLERPATSGHLTFFIGRLSAGTDTARKIPVYINLKKKHMTITHTSHTEMREYEAFEEPVATYYTKGDANFDGPFGFSGEFESWYLTNELRVPVEAHVKVWLGSVEIKLIDYKKELR